MYFAPLSLKTWLRAWVWSYFRFL